MNNEDLDIKIFSPIKKAPTQEPVVIADEMKRLVISGNIDKAKKLGEAIADSFPESAKKKEFFTIATQCGVEDFTRAIKNQAIILAVFTAEYCLNNFMPDSILSTTALSTLYATLTLESPALYNDLLASTAFSFYYMNIDDKNADPTVIGKTFAVLCDMDDCDCIKKCGETIFKTCLEQYKAMAKSVEFN